MFFHKGRPTSKAASEPSEEEEAEAGQKMPLSPPQPGDPRESSQSKAPKKYATFHIWRTKKKQQPPSPLGCGVFVPHPAPTPVGEDR